MFELILKVLLAHLLGDFIFQNKVFIQDIEVKKLKSPYLYLHISIHFFLLLLVTEFKLNYLVPALLLSISHLIIDIVSKIYLYNKINNITVFILDQIMHFIAISFFIRHFYDYSIDYNLLFNTKNYSLGIAILCVTSVSAVIIKKMMDYFGYPLPNEGIKDAGKYIGMLERIFIFTFICLHFWEGVGFLLAAKSIFRFGDLKENKEIKLTEYILIGTLLSFGLAILIGLVYIKLKTLHNL